MKYYLFILVLILPGLLVAEEYDSLYGFSLGEPVTNVLKKLGVPDREIDLEDGSKVIIFFSEHHYAAFVSIRPNNDFIYSIQVTGDRSSADQSLAGIKLGDPFEKVVKLLESL